MSNPALALSAAESCVAPQSLTTNPLKPTSFLNDPDGPKSAALWHADVWLRRLYAHMTEAMSAYQSVSSLPHRNGIAHLHRSIVRIHVQFMVRPVIDIRRETISPMFLVIGQKVLGACHYAHGLDSHNRFVCRLSSQVRIRSETEGEAQYRKGTRKGRTSPSSALLSGYA